MNLLLQTRFQSMLLIVWWASISALGFWVVPMLFTKLPTPAMAGNLAAQLFEQQSWVALVCGAAVLLINRRAAAWREGVPAQPAAKAAVVVVLIALAAVIINQYGVSPRIVARDNLRVWHSVGTGLYVVQWVCVSLLLWRTMLANTRSAT